MANELFGRKWAVTVGTTRITDLDVTFEIEKTLKDEPNTCSLTVYNLSEDQRAALEELNDPGKAVSTLATSKVKIAARKVVTKGIPVQIEAGYENDGALSLLWLGDLRTAHSHHDGPDWVTVLESGDGEKAWQNARIHVSFGPKTPVLTVLTALVREMGLGEGNLAQVAKTLEVTGTGRLLTRGCVLSGRVQDELGAWCRSADLEYSIVDGAIQFVNRGKALAATAIRLSAETGMIGAPSVDIDGNLKARMLMMPDVRPGRLVVVDAERVKGNYKIEKAKWHGDSAGADWFIEIEAARY